MPVVEASIRYRAPALFEDVLTIVTELAEVRSHSLRFAYEVWRGSDRLADGTTRLACVDDQHELLRIPESLAVVLLRAEERGAEGDAVC